MAGWDLISVIVMLAIAVGCVYNVIRLIAKIKHNPRNLFDLLIGVLIFGAAAGITIYYALTRYIL